MTQQTLEAIKAGLYSAGMHHDDLDLFARSVQSALCTARLEQPAEYSLAWTRGFVGSLRWQVENLEQAIIAQDHALIENRFEYVKGAVDTLESELTKRLEEVTQRGTTTDSGITAG